MTAANDALAEAKAAAATADQKLAASVEEVRSLREWADIVTRQTAADSSDRWPRVAEEAACGDAEVSHTIPERDKSLGMTARVASLESQVAWPEAQQFRPWTRSG